MPKIVYLKHETRSAGGSQIDPPSSQKKLPSKRPALLGLKERFSILSM